MYGNLATEGAVAKITGKEGTSFTGPAKVFDSEELTLAAIEAGKITHGDVVVIRYEGPRAAPAARCCRYALIMGAGLGKSTRSSPMAVPGGTHGLVVGHITPEAQVGGNLALVQDGDTVTLDAKNGLDVHVRRRTGPPSARWQAPAPKFTKGVLYKYMKSVSSASEGYVPDGD